VSKKVTRRTAFSYFAFGAVTFARSGDNRPFPDWTPAFVDKMLTESPWARSSTVTYQLTGARAEIFLTTRFASALPIRRAMALAQFGEAGLQDERAVVTVPPQGMHLMATLRFPRSKGSTPGMDGSSGQWLSQGPSRFRSASSLRTGCTRADWNCKNSL
jgi:hypothetical protein